MPSMPYYLEKGPMFSVIEDYLNADRSRAIEAFHAHADPADGEKAADVRTLAPFQDTAVVNDHVDYRTSLVDRWYGEAVFGSEQTGVWEEYEGDTETITRRTMRLALAVSLGTTIDGDPSTTTRHWPIDVFWKCGQAWFEGWVTWRKIGDDPCHGHVTVIFCTPPDGTVVQPTPIYTGSQKNPSGYEFGVKGSVPANGPDRVAGMTVVTHLHNDAVPSAKRAEIDKVGSGQFELVINPTRTIGHGPIVNVSPPEGKGGIANPPRTMEVSS